MLQSLENHKHDGLLQNHLRDPIVASASDNCREVERLFQKTLDAECAVICNSDNQPLGLVMRNRFNMHLSRRFGAELFHDSPISKLMNAEPLIVNLQEATQSILDKSLGRDERILYDCVIVEHNHRLVGILTIGDLLNMSYTIQQEAVQSQVNMIRGAEQMIKEIDHSVAQVRQSTEHCDDLSVAMVDLTLKGKTGLRKVRDAFTSLTDKATLQENQINDLQSRADAISAVTKLIRDLADQCNLLAVNATIEAARAGEHGRSFAVVANEVRQLATQTKTSADQISSLIRSITEAVSQTVLLVQSGREEAFSSDIFVKEAEELFGQLFHAAAENRSNAQEVHILGNQAYQQSTRVLLEMERIKQSVQQKRG